MAFDMQNDDENDLDLPQDDIGGEAPSEESGNRSFLIIAVILGGIMVFAIVCMVIFALVQLGNKNNTAKMIAANETQNAAMILSSTQTAEAFAKITPTFTPAPPTNTATLKPTNTLVVAPTLTPTSLLGGGPNEATVNALNTEVAKKQTSIVTMTLQATAIPDGGFADDVGAPGLLGLAVVLVVIIFLARRLRMAS